MAATGGSIDLWSNGFATLPVAAVDLNAVGSGVYVDTGLFVTLPGEGSYFLSSNVRCFLGTMNTGEDAWVVARLRWTGPSPGLVLDSEVIVNHIRDDAGAAGVLLTWNTIALIQVGLTVSGPGQVRLEAARFTGAGTTDAAQIQNDANGRTTLSYERVR